VLFDSYRSINAQFLLLRKPAHDSFLGSGIHHLMLSESKKIAAVLLGAGSMPGDCHYLSLVYLCIQQAWFANIAM
jgi:hypothetical protein